MVLTISIPHPLAVIDESTCFEEFVIFLLECFLGMVLFLIGDVFVGLRDNRLAHRECPVTCLPRELPRGDILLIDAV